ncbi:MAG: DedA family protein, partial [Thermoplasmata archaeon]
LPAGIGRVPLRVFVPFTFFGALIWSTILASAGFYLGQAAFDFAESLESFDLLVLAALAVLLVGFLLFRWWRRSREALGEPQSP